MITGLLFTLAQKPLQAANDTTSAKETKAEGRRFPSPTKQRSKAPTNIVALTRNVSLALTVLGAILLGVGAADWSFDPAAGLHIRTALVSFTLPVGVLS
jgi:hypothetical protein